MSIFPEKALLFRANAGFKIDSEVRFLFKEPE
jgi:hypothetical protein